MVLKFVTLLKKFRMMPQKALSSMQAKTVKVSVKQGTLIGLQRCLPNGIQYESFQGIPYALPPVGKLRFRSPVPLEHFDVAELDCRNERDVSHQRDPFRMEVVGSENCLHLNIFTPKLKRQSPLPVMVWIHGGGYWFGNGNSDYHFPAQLLEEEVVVVTLNYRLGALGFLYLPEEGIHGNAGLKDQRLALQWVQQNIANFNGDPNNVTLFGESAGASSVHLHAYAGHANKLFHKAIVQSGTANMEWVLQLNPGDKTRRLAEMLGYEAATSDTKKLLEFLQSEEATPLGMLAKTMSVLSADERRRGLPLTFKPVVENTSSPDSFIDKPIMKLLTEKNRLKNLPMIMGYNSAEGLSMLVNAVRKMNDYENDLARLVPRDLIVNPQDVAALDVAKRMRDFYFKGGKINEEQLDALVDIFTDYHFNIDLQNAAEIHVRNQIQSPLYFYRFDYIGGRNIYKRLFQFEHLRGACHADELFYLFQMADDETALTAEDARMSKHLCHLWANFARCGNPSSSDCKWTPVQNSDDKFKLDYLLIDRQSVMKSNPDAERIQFWREMYEIYRPSVLEPLRSKL